MHLRSALASIFLASSLALMACGGPLKLTLRGTSMASGSDAVVTAKIDIGRAETELNVEASNLAPPDRIEAGFTTFVIWVRKDDKSQWARTGSLEYDAGGRTGKWHGTTAETNFDLQITIEKEAAAAVPSGKTVFNTHVQKQ